MNITLELSIAGVCVVVLRRARQLVSVLVPDATQERNALDDQRMAPHYSALVYRDDRFKVPRRLSLGAGGPDFDSVRYGGFVHLDDVVPDHPVDTRHLDDDAEANANAITSRIDLGAGSMMPARSGSFWTIEPQLPESRIRGGLFTGVVTWRIEDLPRRELDPLNGLERIGAGSPLELGNEEVVQLEVRNFPVRDHDHHPPHPLPRPGEPDDDFRWFYEVVSGRNQLRSKLAGRSLPLPTFQCRPVDDSTVEVLEPPLHRCIGVSAELGE